MEKIRITNFLSFLLLMGFISACTNLNSKRIPGAITEVGNGVIESYAEVDAEGVPLAIGVEFSETSLENLPEKLTDGNRCADLNGDDIVERASECSPWHERVLPLPTGISRRSDIPFKWVLLNYNPEGHIPPGVWDIPHFDVHFYMEPIEDVFALMPGPCGPEHIRCDQFEIAIKPVPSNYIHDDFKNVDAAAPAMGNHLVDPTAPEFNGDPFTRSWIFGAYDGKITFWEEMLSVDYLKSKPEKCVPIKLPEAVAKSGYYPTTVCTRHDAENAGITVSVEEFKYREAEPPTTGD